MTATTLVVPPEALAAATWRIEGEAHHHLFRVKRLTVGAPLRLTDGAGRARFAEVLTISKRDALARLGEGAPGNESALAVELFVAPPKPERAAWLVEKATEVGVAAVRFLPAERGARDLGEAQLARLRRVATAAVEQSGRAVVPAIGASVPLPAVIEELSAAGAAIRALDAGGSPVELVAGAAAVAVLVGPEGVEPGGAAALRSPARPPLVARGSDPAGRDRRPRRLGTPARAASGRRLSARRPGRLPAPSA